MSGNVDCSAGAMGTAFDTCFHLARRLRNSSEEKCCLVAEILRSQSLTPVPQIYPLLELHFSVHFVLQRFYGYFIESYGLASGYILRYSQHSKH